MSGAGDSGQRSPEKSERRLPAEAGPRYGGHPGEARQGLAEKWSREHVTQIKVLVLTLAKSLEGGVSEPRLLEEVRRQCVYLTDDMIARFDPVSAAISELLEEGKATWEWRKAAGWNHDRVIYGQARIRVLVPTLQPSHSPDFTSVDWSGTRYTFSKGNQAEAVRVLWEARKAGGHSLSQETIGKRIGSSADRFQLPKVFRRPKAGGGYEKHPAWGTMIRQATKELLQNPVCAV